MKCVRSVSLAFAVLLWLSTSAEAQIKMTVDQLREMIRSSLALKHDDKKIAKYLDKVELTEKLEQSAVEDLMSQGAGPKTTQALQKLEAASASLKGGSGNAPSATANSAGAGAAGSTSRRQGASANMTPQGPPPPSAVEQQKMLDQARQYAMSYTQTLPNFLCLQVIRRFVDFDSSDRWRLMDTVTTQLSYSEGQEHYRAIMVNSKPTSASLDQLGGAISQGEFGTMMKEVFDNSSQADFNWDHWGTLRGKLVGVFNYFIDSGHSQYSISYESSERIYSAYRGLVYMDPYTGVISRITEQAVDIPAGFPVKQAESVLDYADVDINGNRYFCPLKVTTKMGTARQHTRNDAEFRLYRKFGTESSITFETPDQLSDEQTTEKPATNAPAPQQQPGAPTGGAPPYTPPTIR